MKFVRFEIAGLAAIAALGVGNLALSANAQASQSSATTASDASAPATSSPASGKDIFDRVCMACHNGDDIHAPPVDELAKREPEEIVRILTSGAMQPMAMGLSAADKAAVAQYVTSLKAEHEG